jgi:hypothetical protein
VVQMVLKVDILKKILAKKNPDSENRDFYVLQTESGFNLIYVV